MHGVAGGGLFLDPGDELRAREFLGVLDGAPIALRGHDHVAQVHVQAQLVDVGARGGCALRIALSGILC